MKLKTLLCLLLLLGAQGVARAAFWRCELPGGVYVVNTTMLASVSIHEYVVSGLARVTELTIATNSAVVARFYYLEPLTPSTPGGVGASIPGRVVDKAAEAAGRVGVEKVWEKVVKDYPATTHAHTVEYRVESTDQLDQMQQNLEDCWRNNHDGVFKIDE